MPLTGELLALALNLMDQEISYLADRIRSFHEIAVNDSSEPLPESTSLIISKLCIEMWEAKLQGISKITTAEYQLSRSLQSLRPLLRTTQADKQQSPDI